MTQFFILQQVTVIGKDTVSTITVAHVKHLLSIFGKT